MSQSRQRAIDSAARRIADRLKVDVLDMDGVVAVRSDFEDAIEVQVRLRPERLFGAARVSSLALEDAHPELLVDLLLEAMRGARGALRGAVLRGWLTGEDGPGVDLSTNIDPAQVALVVDWLTRELLELLKRSPHARERADHVAALAMGFVESLR